jgi:hypothetical protein
VVSSDAWEVAIHPICTAPTPTTARSQLYETLAKDTVYTRAKVLTEITGATIQIHYLLTSKPKRKKKKE